MERRGCCRLNLQRFSLMPTNVIDVTMPPLPTSRTSPRPSSKRPGSGSSKSLPVSSKPKAESALPSPQPFPTPPCSVASPRPYSVVDHDKRGARASLNPASANLKPKIHPDGKALQSAKTAFVPQKRPSKSQARYIRRARRSNLIEPLLVIWKTKLFAGTGNVPSRHSEHVVSVIQRPAKSGAVDS